MIEEDFLNHLKRMQLIIHKKVSSNYIGERESLRTGKGTLFKDRGMYTPGDDFRDIDWKVYARTDKLHIKRYEEDKSLTTHIILDASASMNFGSGAIKKFEYASMIGIGFAYMALCNNEKFVLSTFSEKLKRFKAQKGKKQLVDILDYLRNKQAKGKSKFNESLSAYAKTIGSRSMIIVVSDFLYDVDEIKEVLGKFKQCDIKLIQVFDDLEIKMNLQGEYRLKDLETENILKTFLTDITKKNYFKQLEEHNKRLAWVAKSIGAAYHKANTETPIFDTFFEVLKS